MTVRSDCGSHDNKENIPSSSPVKPAVAFSKVSSNKDREIRMPLADITYLYNPIFLPHALLNNSFLIDSASLVLIAVLAYQVQNRRKRGDASAMRNSSAAAILRKHFR